MRIRADVAVVILDSLLTEESWPRVPTNRGLTTRPYFTLHYPDGIRIGFRDPAQTAYRRTSTSREPRGPVGAFAWGFSRVVADGETMQRPCQGQLTARA